MSHAPHCVESKRHEVPRHMTTVKLTLYGRDGTETATLEEGEDLDPGIIGELHGVHVEEIENDLEGLDDLQVDVAAWREETIEGDPTPLSQAGHTSVEANEALDLFVKGETYHPGEGPASGWVDDEHRLETMQELGDVIVANLGTMSLLGLDASRCIEAALEKNGQRQWSSWQGVEERLADVDVDADEIVEELEEDS